MGKRFYSIWRQDSIIVRLVGERRMWQNTRKNSPKNQKKGAVDAVEKNVNPK